MRSRALAFGVICALCVLVGGGWVVIAALGDSATTSDARVGVVPAERLDLRGRVLVRAVQAGDERLNGRVTLVGVGDRPTKARAGDLECARVYERAGRGICLFVAASGVDYRYSLFDARHRVVREEGLDGLPSRARVSPSGRWGSITTFVSGHSYTTQGGFSTKTLILDMSSGETVANLEQLSVEQDGKAIDRPDFNFWGTTFARDDDTFYATLATAGKRYLVKGSLRARHVRVLRANVECPSLSPDERRVAYKKRVGGPSDWRLHVLDLASGRDTPLAETETVDDQAEWLDDDTVLYGRAGSVWAVRADGRGSPQRVLAHAASPAAARG
jgi:hypothetical protein